MQTLSNAYETAKRSVVPVIAHSFAWSGGIDLDDARQQVRDALREIRESTDQGKENLDAKLSEADDILTKIKGKSAELGVTEHAILFEEAANQFSEEKGKWLNVVRWLALVATLLAVGNSVWVFIAAKSGDLKVGESIQIGLGEAGSVQLRLLCSCLDRSHVPGGRTQRGHQLTPIPSHADVRAVHRCGFGQVHEGCSPPEGDGVNLRDTKHQASRIRARTEVGHRGGWR